MIYKDEIQIDFTNMLAENFSDKKYGISQQDINKINSQTNKAFDEVINKSSVEAQTYLDLVRNPKDIKEIEQFAEEVCKKFDNFVVLGIGGSALGTRALFASLTNIHYNRMEKQRGKRPRLFIRDSIDPDKFEGLLEILDSSKTMFCIVTKSGSTLETMLQMSIVEKELKKKVGKNYYDHFCVITSIPDTPLHKWVIKNKVKTFYFSQNLSGRFSVFSAVGLLPAAVVGVDIRKVLKGGNYMLDRCSNTNIENNPALMGATLQKIAINKGVNISFLMPYADNLRVIADWYCQLWAESLGKTIQTKEGKCFIGQTPVRAFGTVDQHSQMQLCLEGPYDKVITFIRVLKFDRDATIPKMSGGLLADYICGRKMSEILITSQKATQQALIECNHMNRTIIIPKVDEFAIGELLMYFMLETSFIGAMFGLNTYNQPSVELIKQNIKKMLSKK